VTDADLATLADEYEAGVEAQLRLLHQLDQIATRQRDVTVARNFEAFSREAELRGRLTQSLVAIEQDLKPVRNVLVEHRSRAQRLPSYARITARHREATDLVAKVLTTDRDSFRALADAELARRAALSGLEQGEMTLAAYRKVLAPPVSGATLVDERG